MSDIAAVTNVQSTDASKKKRASTKKSVVAETNAVMTPKVDRAELKTPGAPTKKLKTVAESLTIVNPDSIPVKKVRTKKPVFGDVHEYRANEIRLLEVQIELWRERSEDEIQAIMDKKNAPKKLAAPKQNEAVADLPETVASESVTKPLPTFNAGRVLGHLDESTADLLPAGDITIRVTEKNVPYIGDKQLTAQYLAELMKGSVSIREMFFDVNESSGGKRTKPTLTTVAEWVRSNVAAV